MTAGFLILRYFLGTLAVMALMSAGVTAALVIASTRVAHGRRPHLGRRPRSPAVRWIGENIRAKLDA